MSPVSLEEANRLAFRWIMQTNIPGLKPIRKDFEKRDWNDLTWTWGWSVEVTLTLHYEDVHHGDKIKFVPRVLMGTSSAKRSLPAMLALTALQQKVCELAALLLSVLSELEIEELAEE